MADSTLYVTFDEIEAEIGRYMTTGRDNAAWTADQSTEIAQIIKAGCRLFYYPPALPDEKHTHKWSFLTPTDSLLLTPGAKAVNLPENFGGVEGKVTFTQGQGIHRGIDPIEESVWREMHTVETDGFPVYYTIMPVAQIGGGVGQRYMMGFWPTPDAAYVVELKYEIVPEAVSDGAGGFKYHAGTAKHSELFIQACLASAERRYDHHESSYQYDHFLRLLSAAVDRDRQSFSPRRLGYNGDGSAPLGRRAYTGVDTYNDTPV